MTKEQLIIPHDTENLKNCSFLPSTKIQLLARRIFIQYKENKLFPYIVKNYRFGVIYYSGQVHADFVKNLRLYFRTHKSLFLQPDGFHLDELFFGSILLKQNKR